MYTVHCKISFFTSVRPWDDLFNSSCINIIQYIEPSDRFAIPIYTIWGNYSNLVWAFRVYRYNWFPSSRQCMAMRLYWFFSEAYNLTPFMYAIRNRVYPAAIMLFETAQRLARATSQYPDALLSMIYPPGSPADDSPLHNLLYNDPCSFTWTGEEHIDQVYLNFATL